LFPKTKEDSLCTCARLGFGWFRKRAHDQGQTIADQQALDQDAGVIAPSEDSEAEGKGDGIRFGKKSLEPMGTRVGNSFSAAGPRPQAGNTATVLPVDIAQLSGEESLLRGDEK
jgi:hypothetical protein